MVYDEQLRTSGGDLASFGRIRYQPLTVPETDFVPAVYHPVCTEETFRIHAHAMSTPICSALFTLAMTSTYPI